MNTILESQDNDKILSVMLADEILTTRQKKYPSAESIIEEMKK